MKEAQERTEREIEMRKIGFIGTGVLASSIVKGICGYEGHEPLPEVEIVVSPRNGETSAELAALFPNVAVAASNQEVLDRSDWAFLSVVPRAAEEIVRELTFRPDQAVISLIAARRIEVVSSWTGPVSRIVRMVPMPFIAHRIGPLAMYPHDRELEAFFAPLCEEVVAMDAEEQMDLANVITSVTNSTYTLIQSIVDWGEANGMPREASLRYTVSYFGAMCGQIRGEHAAELPRFVEERTPNGINDAILKHVTAKGSIDVWTEGMDLALARIRGNGR